MRASAFLISLLSTVAWGATASAVGVDEVPNPRHASSWVTDMADALTPQEEAELDRMVDGLNARTGAEIAVVTVESVDTATPKDFATALFNRWGIGRTGVDDGLLVLMVMSERRLEMETGYGMETVLADGWLKQMQQDEMVPRFKEGRYGAGLLAGVGSSIEKIEKGPTFADRYQAVADDSPLPPLPVAGGILGLLGLGGGAAALRRRKWKHDRTCPECGELMEMLPEDEDDEHLTEGQQTEEAIGSIDWEYWYCTKDEFGRLLANQKWFSGYGPCPKCDNRTLSSTSSTLEAATQYSTGLREVVKDCAHCNYHRRTTHIIPRLPEPSSSSSSSSFGGGSSGGSFGGGSSGGGGAGSSW